VALGRFSPSSSVSPAIVVRSTNYSTITLMYHPGKMYNRPMRGRSTGTYTNLGDLQRDLMGVKSHPTTKKKSTTCGSNEEEKRFICSLFTDAVRSSDYIAIKITGLQ
jgi:hypothetical protein